MVTWTTIVIRTAVVAVDAADSIVVVAVVDSVGVDRLVVAIGVDSAVDEVVRMAGDLGVDAVGYLFLILSINRYLID